MPALREIQVKRTDLSVRHGRNSSCLAEEIMKGLQQRTVEAGYYPHVHFKPVHRVIFEKCTGFDQVQRFVDVLKEELELVIVD